MPLTNKAYLVIPGPEGDALPDDDGVFELRGVETTEEFDKELLLGNRGQIISQISDVIPFVPRIGEEGTGLNIDGGGGRDSVTLEVEITEDFDAQWGAGARTTPPGDAQLSGPLTKGQVLKFWARKSRTDSESPAKLHWGEWTNGDFDDVDGAFGSPIDVVVQSVTIQDARDDPSAVIATIEVLRTTDLPEIDGDLFGDLEETITGGSTRLGDIFNDLK